MSMCRDQKLAETDSALLERLPVVQWSTVKLLLAFQCDDAARAGIGPQTFVEMPCPATSDSSNEHPERALAEDSIRRLRVFFPSLREQQPTAVSGTHTCVVEAGVDDELVNGNVDEQRLVRVLLDRLERLFPAITQQTIVSYRLVIHAPEAKALAQSVERYQSKLTAKTDINGLLLGGCDVSTFGVGGCLQAGWVAANAALDYGWASLFAGDNVLNDILHG